MTAFNPKFTITNGITAAITQIERTRGFLEAALLSDDWVRDMGNLALIKEAHHTTHKEGTRLTTEQAERLWNANRFQRLTLMMSGNCSITVQPLSLFQNVWTAVTPSPKG